MPVVECSSAFDKSLACDWEFTRRLGFLGGKKRPVVRRKKYYSENPIILGVW